jgi:hypothetical protein
MDANRHLLYDLPSMGLDVISQNPEFATGAEFYLGNPSTFS